MCHFVFGGRISEFFFLTFNNEMFVLMLIIIYLLVDYGIDCGKALVHLMFACFPGFVENDD